MTRLVFPDESSQLVYRISGQSLMGSVGATATVYADAGATMLANLLTHNGTGTPGAAISGSTLTVDSTSRLPLFWGPDGVDTVYIKVSSGPATAVYARTDDRLDALAAADAAEAAARAAADTTEATARSAGDATLAASIALLNGPLAPRTTAQYTTAVLGAGASEQGTITMAKSYRALRIQTSAAARVRLYTTAANRAADVARAVGTDPAAGTGVMLDYLTTAGVGVSAPADLSPQVLGSSTEAVPSAAIPITVTPTGAGAVTVTLTYAALETA